MSDKSDAFGDRMKFYEMAEAGRRVMSDRIPVVARLDGKGFSNFTRGLTRPYDKRLSDLMVDTTTFLVKLTNAVCGYCQSDEITLAWYSEDYDSQIWFDGRIQKMTSVLASKASVYFNRRLPDALPEKDKLILENGEFDGPVFDCRLWNVPNLDEGANAFLWRELDATKNAISMAARHYYSHKMLENKSGPEMQEMLFQKGVNFNDYPAFFKRGTYVQRKKIVGKLSIDDLEKLPPLHNARKNPDLEVERTEYRRLDLPRMTQIKNRVGVIFFGEEPVLEQ